MGFVTSQPPDPKTADTDPAPPPAATPSTWVENSVEDFGGSPPARAEFETKPEIGPTAGIVRGSAVLSPWREKQIQQIKADTERRWKEQDEEIAAAKAGTGDPIGARRMTFDMGQSTTHPVAVIRVISRDGSKERYIQADIIIATAPDGTISRVANLICPRCVARGIPQHQAQLRVDDRNKKWSLDTSVAGKTWIDPDTGHPFILAGKIDMSEKGRCGQLGCDFAFRINPLGDPLVSTIVFEDYT